MNDKKDTKKCPFKIFFMSIYKTRFKLPSKWVLFTIINNRS